ncbi:hypothetical protein ACTAQI_11765 [Pseudarthrobacter sp. alpha12b]
MTRLIVDNSEQVKLKLLAATIDSSYYINCFSTKAPDARNNNLVDASRCSTSGILFDIA